MEGTQRNTREDEVVVTAAFISRRHWDVAYRDARARLPVHARYSVSVRAHVDEVVDVWVYVVGASVVDTNVSFTPL
eukprot:750459-Pleurochrysis_carterae.AAC.3